MAQLVGQRCIRCAEVIGSILEAEWCAGCKKPVHRHCKTSDGQPQTRTHCPRCGADPSMELSPDYRVDSAPIPRISEETAPSGVPARVSAGPSIRKGHKQGVSVAAILV